MEGAPATSPRYRRIHVDSLMPFPGNARRGNVELLADSLSRYGQYRPLVVQRQGLRVLAGNHTLEAAMRLGWTHVDVGLIDCDDETAARINLLDNRSNDLAGYDTAALAAQLSALDDLAGTGWDADGLQDLLDSIAEGPEPPLNDADDVPALRPEAVSQVGDVWELGRHRLVCGDCTDPVVWEQLLGGEQAHLMWTDPPYGVGYVGKTADRLQIPNDALEGPALQALLAAAFDTALPHIRPGAGVYVAAPSGALFLDFAVVLAERDLWRQTLVWVKDQFVMGRSDYHYRHESIFYGWVPGGAHRPPPDRTQDTVWEIDRPRRSAEHPTMKPVALIVRALQNSTAAGQLVVDPFAGSGSTLIAAQDTGRQARVIELDPSYADVICRRFQEHTAVLPVRNGLPVDFTSLSAAA